MDPHEQLDEWVNRRMAVSQPPDGWPVEDVARRQLDQRVARPPRTVLRIAAVAAVCGALFVVPQTRAVAQRLWDQVFLGRLQMLIADDESAAASLFSPELQHRPEPRQVQSFEEASQLAGYSPRLPAINAFATTPRYSVTDATSATLRLDTPAIRRLIVRVGGTPGEVPDTWNGAVLEVRVGPVVIADYGPTLLLQSRPFQLMAPPDFDLETFYRIAFQAFGMRERDARTLSADLRISPALLTFMPREDNALVHEFQSRSSTVLMIDEVYGHEKTLAVWSTPDRLYALFGATAVVNQKFVTEVTNALE
jgi:hypothetical protein